MRTLTLATREERHTAVVGESDAAMAEGPKVMIDGVAPHAPSHGASAPPAAGLPLLDELLLAPTQRSQSDRGYLSTCAVHPF